MSEIEERHEALILLLDRAEQRAGVKHDPGEARAHTDRFVAAASRHTATSARILVPTVRQALRGGSVEVRDFVSECKRLERTLVKAKAKQYGQAQTVNEPWSSVWGSVHRQLARILFLERRLVAMLGEHLESHDQHQLRIRFIRAVAGAPTRPHPNLPHTGASGFMARLVSAKLDSLWDELEGRITSLAPIRPDALNE